MLTVIVLVLVGSWFLFSLKFCFFAHPKRTVKTYVAGTRESGNHPMKTLTLALAGTLGVGNVSGVVLALRKGGPGVTFWLVFSALFGATLKYAESVSTLTSDGNPRYKGIAKLLSEHKILTPVTPIYIIFTLCLAVFMGWMLQSSAVVTSAEPLQIPPFLTVLLLLLFLIPPVLRGVGSIEKLTEILIPAVALLYAFLTLSVIIKNAQTLPSVLKTILIDAFSKDGRAGNFLAVECGFSAGLLSNEAGAGTSTLAHDRTSNTPVAEGILGVLEALTDTAILCPLTALAVLCSGVPLTGNATMVVASALSLVFGDLSYPLLFFCVFVFAFATVICWFAYAEISIGMLTPKKLPLLLTLTAGFLSVALGSVIPETFLAKVSGVILSALIFFTLPALLLSKNRILSVSRSTNIIKSPKTKTFFKKTIDKP